MTLIGKLEREKEILEEAVFDSENEYQYFKHVTSKLQEYKDLRNILDVQMLEYLMIAKRKAFTFNDVTCYLNIILDCILKRSDKDLTFKLLDYTYYMIQIDAIQIILDTTSFDIKDLYLKIVESKGKLIEQVKKIEPGLDFYEILVHLNQLGLHIFRDFDLFKEFIKIVSDYDGELDVDFCRFINYRDKYNDLEYIKKSKYKKSDPILLQDGTELSTKEYIEGSNVAPLLQSISFRYAEISKKRDAFEKDRIKKISLYEKVISKIKDTSESLLFNLNDIQYNKLEDEICYDVLKHVLEHNRKVYLDLKLENIKYGRYNDIEALFLKYGYSLDELSDELKMKILKNVKFDDIEKILFCLSLKEWQWFNVNNKNFAQVLLNVDINDLKYVTACMESEIVSGQFVKNNIGILLGNSNYQVDQNDVQPIHCIFKNNLELLAKNIPNLNRKFLKNDQILLCESDVLLKTFNLVKIYNLNFESENCKMYGFDILNNFEYFDYLDSFIELGYANYIKDNMQLLRNGVKDIVARLSIMVNIGMNTMSIENRLLGSITNGKNFYISQENLSRLQYLKVEEYYENENYSILETSQRIEISKETEKLAIVRYLDDLFKISELEYLINDTIISRNKFLRNIECLNKTKKIDANAVIAALTYHSVLDDETIELIEIIVSNNLEKDKNKKFSKSNI